MAAADLTATVRELEDQTWQALQKSGSDFLPFLAKDCVMLFPLGMRVSHTSDPSLTTIMTSEAFVPWYQYKMKDVEVIPVGSDGAIITYKAEATRSKDDPIFRALISSTWRKDASSPSGQWLLCCHQQTPYEEEIE